MFFKNDILSNITSLYQILGVCVNTNVMGVGHEKIHLHVNVIK